MFPEPLAACPRSRTGAQFPEGIAARPSKPSPAQPPRHRGGWRPWQPGRQRSGASALWLANSRGRERDLLLNLLETEVLPGFRSSQPSDQGACASRRPEPAFQQRAASARAAPCTAWWLVGRWVLSPGFEQPPSPQRFWGRPPRKTARFPCGPVSKARPHIGQRLRVHQQGASRLKRQSARSRAALAQGQPVPACPSGFLAVWRWLVAPAPRQRPAATSTAAGHRTRPVHRPAPPARKAVRSNPELPPIPCRIEWGVSTVLEHAGARARSGLAFFSQSAALGFGQIPLPRRTSRNEIPQSACPLACDVLNLGRVLDPFPFASPRAFDPGLEAFLQEGRPPTSAAVGNGGFDRPPNPGLSLLPEGVEARRLLGV